MDKNISFISCHESFLNVENVEMKLILSDDTLSPENKFGKEMHLHFHTEAVVCNGEEATITFENKKLVIHRGEIALYPEKLLHVIKNSDFKTHCFGLYFKKLPVKCNVDLYSSLVKLLQLEDAVIFRIGTEKCAEITAMTENKNISTQSLLRVFNFLLSLSEQVDKTKSDFERNSLANYSIILVKELEQVVDRHYAKRMTNEEVAVLLNISSRQLYEIVKKRYSTSMQQLFIRKRLEKAIALIANTELTISQICDQIGWSTNLTSFFKAFKSKYGVPPSEYRESLR